VTRVTREWKGGPSCPAKIKLHKVSKRVTVTRIHQPPREESHKPRTATCDARGAPPTPPPAPNGQEEPSKFMAWGGWRDHDGGYTLLGGGYSLLLPGAEEAGRCN